jgi:hypothetical protein
MVVKDLTRIAARSVRFQSASVCGVAENRSQHCPGRRHAILAHTVGITLEGQLNITVAKQSLYRFRISPNADPETMPGCDTDYGSQIAMGHHLPVCRCRLGFASITHTSSRISA